MAAPSPAPWFGWTLAALAAAAALVWSNPGPEEFEAFAARQLVGFATEELCGTDGLPMTVRLLVQNCPALIAGQREALGRLAEQGTARYNLGLFSLYSTTVGGQTLLPGLTIPVYRAVTLAGAGQLALLHTSSDNALQQR
jgi:hypothetical protein